MHISNLYHSEPTSRLAQRLVALAFPSRVFFSNSGSEANEAAIKFARRVGNEQGRTELFAFDRSFHGRTMGVLSLTWTPKYREPFAPLLPDTGFLPWGDLNAIAERVGPRTAAVLVEPVQGEGGLRPASIEFLQGLRRICTERGALLIIDEIQCGFGRTGKMFAYEHARDHARHSHRGQASGRRPPHGGDPSRGGVRIEDPRGRPWFDLRRESGVRGRVQRHPRSADHARFRRIGGEEGRAASARPQEDRPQAQDSDRGRARPRAHAGRRVQERRVRWW